MTDLELLQSGAGHLLNAKGYDARNPVPVEDLLRMAKGKPRKVPLNERWRNLVCFIKGHDLATDRWHSEDGGWFLRGDYELHLACRRCRFVLVLDPKETPEFALQPSGASS